MFIKLVVMILVFGSSGVGLLSVRQSRLQAAHEMAEARLRVRLLDEQAGEVRTKIASMCTPDRVMGLLQDPSIYEPSVFHQTQIMPQPDIYEMDADNEPILVNTLDSEPIQQSDQTWILNDGSRVILIDR